MRRIWAFIACFAASPVSANDARDAFVEANLLGIFYHELGHALIEIMSLPVFGQEEDAADVASVILIDAFYDEAGAQDLAYATALGFLGQSVLTDEVVYWGVHGPDEQRFYNTVCLFYGGNPDLRYQFAVDMELPVERAAYCEEEFQLAYDSWGPVLDEIEGAGSTIRFDDGGHRGLTVDIMAFEVGELNRDFRLPENLGVRVARCGEANAFFDPGALEIVMCIEFEDHLRDIYGLFH